MGILFSILFSKDNNTKLKNILDISDEECHLNDNIEENYINNLCLKIHIVGLGDKM